MAMRKKFVVIDMEEECPTMDEKEEVFEVFGLMKTASARAEKAAQKKPGTTFTIFEAVIDVRCAVGRPIRTTVV